MSALQQAAVARDIKAFLAIHDGIEPTIATLLRSALDALDPELPSLEGVDIANFQMVAMAGGGKLILVMAPSPEMTKDEALVHASWLVALADPLHERFPSIQRMVLNT